VAKKYKKGIVIINEQHRLLPEQKTILEENFEEYELLKVPQEGWTFDEIVEIAEKVHIKLSGAEATEITKNVKRILYPAVTEGNAAVFVSPVPCMIRELQALSVIPTEGPDMEQLYAVLIFHNDRREKKELPGGKIIYTVAETGWQLV